MSLPLTIYIHASGNAEFICARNFSEAAAERNSMEKFTFLLFFSSSVLNALGNFTKVRQELLRRAELAVGRGASQAVSHRSCVICTCSLFCGSRTYIASMHMHMVFIIYVCILRVCVHAHGKMVKTTTVYPSRALCVPDASEKYYTASCV
jgi:hypothetical protein